MDKTTFSYYCHNFLNWLAGGFRTKPVVIRLAVPGSTASGKTYLLADIVGSIEKLGYEYCPRLAGNNPHRNKQDLISNQGLTTPRASFRQKDLYVLPFKLRNSRHAKILLVKLLDVPGEAMHIDSLHMFNAIKESLTNCNKKYFEVTTWWNAEHHCAVRTVKARENVKGTKYPGIIIHVPPRGNQASNEYINTESRELQLQEEDYKAVNGWKFWKKGKITGAELFEHFLDYDTDSAIEAIYDAWEKLDIASHLPASLKGDNDPTGCEHFRQAFQNDFFCHYYTEKATDVVICDLCCTPSAHEQSPESKQQETAASPQHGVATSNKDHFIEMMQALEQVLKSGTKKSYMVLKAIDLVMKDDPYRELYRLSGMGSTPSLLDDEEHGETANEPERDPNLVYSLFIMLLAKARHLGLLSNGEKANECQMPDTITAEQARTWLTEAETRNTPDDTINWVVGAYNSLNKDLFDTFFEDPENYSTPSGLSLDEHIKQRIDEFRSLNPIPDDQVKGAAEKMLDLPKHTYFVATPIDDDLRKCEPTEDSPTLFTGKAQYYNHRMHFGALQLTIDMLKNASTSIDYSDTYKGFGRILEHFFD